VDERALRSFLRGAVEGLGLRPPCTAEELCAALGAARGRPVLLVPRADLPVRGGFGCLVRYPDRDLIVLQQRSTAAGRAWIVFHELTHLLRDHTSVGAASWCGGVGGSAPYDGWQEWEAETGAAVLSEWATAPPRPPPAGPVERAVARGFGATRGPG
jgi:hypothetical protein